MLAVVEKFSCFFLLNCVAIRQLLEMLYFVNKMSGTDCASV